MLIRFHLLFILCFTALADTGDQQLFVDPNLLTDALSELVTSKYLDDLAEAFASKAADKFIDAVQKKQMFIKSSRISIEAATVPVPLVTTTEPGTDEVYDLIEKEAMAWLEGPSADGDNLDEEGQLSEISSEKKKNLEPQEMRKINGKYFRRLLDLFG